MAMSCLMTTDVLQAQIDSLTKTVERQGGALKTAKLTVDKLNPELASLRRMRYGRSSKQMDAQQLELLAQTAQTTAASVIDLQAARARRQGKPNRRPELRHLPEHLPRETLTTSPGTAQIAVARTAARSYAPSGKTSRKSWTTSRAASKPSTTCDPNTLVANAKAFARQVPPNARLSAA